MWRNMKEEYEGGTRRRTKWEKYLKEEYEGGIWRRNMEEKYGEGIWGLGEHLGRKLVVWGSIWGFLGKESRRGS